MDLGRIGLFLGVGFTQKSAAALRADAEELEELGYGTLWVTEGPGTRESFSQSATLLAWTDRIVVATGISSIYARDPMAMANGARTFAEAYPGRFLLGVGVSHRVDVAGRGHVYGAPIPTMRAYLDAMDQAAYLPEEPAGPPPRVLAALGPKMLALAAERAWGAIPYLTTPEHTAFARGILGDNRFLGPEQGFVLTEDPDEARSMARKWLVYFLASENYWNNLVRMGFTEEDRADGGSERLIDALIAWGGLDAVCAHVRRHFDAGADHVVVQALGKDPMSELRALAPAILSL